MEKNDKFLPDVIITKQDKEACFTINGNQYNGIQEVLPNANTKFSNLANLKFDIYQDKYCNYILRRCEKYPCFDSHDYAYENRFFRRYMICSSMEEAIKKYNYIEEHNESFNLSNRNSSLLAPLIYADDDRPMIEIITCFETEFAYDSMQRSKSPLSKQNNKEVTYMDRFKNKVIVNVFNDNILHRITQANKHSDFEFLGDTYSYNQLISAKTLKIYWDEYHSTRELVKDKYGRLFHHRYDETLNFDDGPDRIDLLWTLVADEKDSDNLSGDDGLSLMRIPFIASDETDWLAAHENTDSNFSEKIIYSKWMLAKTIFSWIKSILSFK